MKYYFEMLNFPKIVSKQITGNDYESSILKPTPRLIPTCKPSNLFRGLSIMQSSAQKIPVSQPLSKQVYIF